MNEKNFDFDEFIQSSPPENSQTNEESEAAELDVQKAVVEDFAAEKIQLVAKNEQLQTQVATLQRQADEYRRQIAQLEQTLQDKAEQLDKTSAWLDDAKKSLSDAQSQLQASWLKFDDDTARNPNALALLDRDAELPDRFPGETRDLVIEIVKSARDAAEKANQSRRAQLLEGVLVANEPNGTLAKYRDEVEQLLRKNGYLINGEVIEKLKSLGITHKNGATYLTATEIMAFNF